MRRTRLLTMLWLSVALLHVTCVPADTVPAVTARIVLQSAMVAGLRHHDAKLVWDSLRVGDTVELVREAQNVHDGNAVRVDWNGSVLGYLPQAQNQFVARQLDRGNALRARISALGKYRNHHRKLAIEIYAGISPGAH